MKTAATFVLALLTCVSAKAQFGGMGGMGGRPATQAQSIDLELLEMEQEADKAALKEALLLQARQGMKPVPDTRADQVEHAAEIVRLRDFIDKKKDAITKRAAELADKRTGSRRRVPAGPRPDQPLDGDKQAAIEKYEKAKVDVRLLEAQILLLRTPMDEAINALAKAELDESKDEAKRPVAEAARREFERIKAKVVEHNKRLQLEQRGMQQLGSMMGGMGMM